MNARRTGNRSVFRKSDKSSSRKTNSYSFSYIKGRSHQVNTWLERIFGGESIPQYEVNSFTVDKLYFLMKQNEEQDKYTSILLDDVQEKTEEYRVEAKRLSNILEKLSLLPGSLSQSGTTSLSSLTNVALILDVADASNTNLLLSMNDFSQQSMKVADERRMEQRLSTQLFSKTKSARTQANNLERVLSSLGEQAMKQGPELENKAKQTGFLTNKAKEYKRHIQELHKELAQNKVEPSIYHSALVKKSEELKELREELNPMKARLNSYHQLPPDMALARVKVEETRRELEQIEEQLSKRINLMHM